MSNNIHVMSIGLGTNDFPSIWQALLPLSYKETQGATKGCFTACHTGKLYLACTSPGVIVTSAPKILMDRIIYYNPSVKFEFPQEKAPVGHVTNRIH